MAQDSFPLTMACSFIFLFKCPHFVAEAIFILSICTWELVGSVWLFGRRLLDSCCTGVLESVCTWPLWDCCKCTLIRLLFDCCTYDCTWLLFDSCTWLVYEGFTWFLWYGCTWVLVGHTSDRGIGSSLKIIQE